jgi:hypothetical protein
MVRKHIVLLGAVSLALAALASTASATEVYGGIGTQGYTVGAGTNVTNSVEVRGEVNYFQYSDNFSSGSVNYNAKIKYQNGAVYADWHPFDNGFHLTGGALIGNDKLSGDAQATNGNIEINNHSYSAAGQSLHASLNFPTVRPYVGLGYGHAQSTGFGFYADLGVAYGKPSVDLTASPTLAAAAATDLATEKSDLQSKANDLKFMPVLSLGVSYGF